MSSLDTLAWRLGIEDRFQAATGEIRETSETTKKALLTAMGIAVTDDGDADRALAALDAREWERSLPPVRVASSEAEITIEPVIPSPTQEFRWTLSLENGDELSGTTPCDDGTRVAQRELDGRVLERHRLVLPADIPWGYHRLRSVLDDSVCVLIVTPGTCWLPRAAEQNERMWGISTQLYLLRSTRNWGIGDFTDLGQLARLVADLGGDVVGLNPLHAMFLDNPEHASPYSPENRLLLNVLNIDVEAVPELNSSPEAQQLIASQDFHTRLEQCRAAALVDYTNVAELKLQSLKLLFECCRTAIDSQRWADFEKFRHRRGDTFEKSCLFEALRQHFAGINGSLADWHSWPAGYRDASSEAVERFAIEHSGDVTFYAWMQWLADQQLGAAAEAGSEMRIGLYRDLAVGADACGAATWSNPEAVVSQAHAGAPPDIHNPAGQDWGLPPFDPRVLFETAYQNFIELVRANMRHAGGLRIDHVMALQHLYWVPVGSSAADGAYVSQRLEDLVGILALESHRNHCLVVGEDLGTVPEGFRERMAAANILSYRVLFFEQDMASGAFLPPTDYPRLAVAVSGSHDLPTIRGWWEGRDIELKESMRLYPTEAGPSDARQLRERDRKALISALREQQLLPENGPPSMERLDEAIHRFLARTTALIAIAQLDDVTAEADQVNVPTSSDQHPNWRRRQSVTLELLPEDFRLQRLASLFHEERGRA